MTDKVRRALEQGYVFFKCYGDNKIHKGFIREYHTPYDDISESFVLVYGVGYHSLKDDLWVYDDEELIKNPKKHEFYPRCGLYEYAYQSVDISDYGDTWSLSESTLKECDEFIAPSIIAEGEDAHAD